MATTSLTALRRFTGIGFSLLLFSLCLCAAAAGQAPAVTASFNTGIAHPTGWGTISQTVIDSYGDWLVVDFSNGALYEFPAGGGAVDTLLIPQSLGGGNNPGIAIDPDNGIFLEGNWNNTVGYLPYDTGTNSWDGLSAISYVAATGNDSASVFCPSGSASPPPAPYGFACGDTPNGVPSGVYYFQPWAITVGNNNNVIIAGQNSGNFLFSQPVTGGWAAPVAAGGSVNNGIVGAMTTRAVSVAQDPAGDVFFVEDQNDGGTVGLPGVYEVPASAIAAAPTSEAYATDTLAARVDPNLPSVVGVVTDSNGNLYVSDSKAGVFLIPNTSTTPQTTETLGTAVLLTPVPAQGEVAIDWARNILYIPTTQTQTNGQADVAEVKLDHAEFGSSPVGTPAAQAASVSFGFNSATTPAQFLIEEDGVTTPDFAITGGTCQLGTAYAAQSGCSETLTMTPHSVGSITGRLVLLAAPPIATGNYGASATVTAYSTTSGILTLTAANNFAAGQPITFNSDGTAALAALNGLSFNVLSTGLSNSQFEVSTGLVTGSATSAYVTVTGDQYVAIASMLLHGTGTGPNIQVSPALESAIGGGLKTPSQVATDAQGNIYVADAGLGEVVEFAPGASATATPSTIGTGLKAPTGVAVDGAGDVFIADSPYVYEVPFGLSVENATGQQAGLISTGQTTLLSGLGANLNLAVSGSGNLYVADPANARVVKLSAVGVGTSIFGQTETFLTTGFKAPSYVAVDNNNNLYVADGADLFEVASGTTTPTTLLSNLKGTTGLAADPSGAVYIAETGGTERIPSVSGTLSSTGTQIAVSVTSPEGVALDRTGNIYLADGTALNIHDVPAATGTLTFPNVPPAASLDATVINDGNSSLTVTGYTSTSIDFTGADGTCIGDSPLAAGGNCQVDITLNPQAGEQGTLAGQVGIVSNAVDSPVVVDTTGVGAALAPSVTTITVDSSAQVTGTPVTVTVVAGTGATGTPSGEITITYTTWTVLNCVYTPATSTSPASETPGCPMGVSGTTIIPTQATQTATLNSSGVATATLSPVLAGSDTFSVAYGGDRTFGTSTGTVTATVAKSTPTSLAPPLVPGSPISPPYLPYTQEVSAPSGAPVGGQPAYNQEDAYEYLYQLEVYTGVVEPPATLLAEPTIGQPTGTVTFNDNYQAGVSSTLTTAVACTPYNTTGVQTLNGAQVSFNTSCLLAPQNNLYTDPVTSSHVITAVYSGDANFNSITAPSVYFIATRSPAVQICQTVTPGANCVLAPPPAGLVSAAPAQMSLTVQPGASVSANLTLTSVLGYGFIGLNATLNNYTFPVSLACDNLPPHATCTFTYPNPDANLSTAVDIPCPANGNADAANTALCTPGSGYATITINTNVAAGTTTSQIAQRIPVALAAMFGFGMIGLFFRRKEWQKARMTLMLFLAILGGALATSLTACSTTNLTPAADLGTPAGTYPVTVTAEQVGSLTVTNSGNTTVVYGSNNPVSLPFVINLTVQ